MGLVYVFTEQAPRLAFQRLPHRLVALRGPDARIAILCRFVVRPSHVERQAMIENDPLSELWLEHRVRFLVNSAQIVSCRRASLHGAEHFTDECARALDTRLDLDRIHQRRASPR